MEFTGMNPDRDLVEIVELPEHRFYLGVQFHPEYRSTIGAPHPLFRAFVVACLAYARDREMLEQPRPPKRRKPAKLAAAKMHGRARRRWSSDDGRGVAEEARLALAH